MVVLIFITLLFLGISSAAPITALEAEILDAQDEKTVLRNELAPSWATTSNVRGTSDLLWTSVLTLSLCVYTVIHVNIPPPGEKPWRFYRRKMIFMLVAILAPDFALWTAFEQWDIVKHLKDTLNKSPRVSTENQEGKESKSPTDNQESNEPKPPTEIRGVNEPRPPTETQEGNKPKPPEGPQRFGWTYCFYAAMGGIAVDVGAIQDGPRFITLKPPGLEFLAKRGHFIEISESEIDDKSKADTLAKIIICIQVLWLVIQCIGRKVNNLPVALLELHVLAHVVSALVLYTIWFKKPFDIQEPTIIDSSNFEDEIALMVLLSDRGGGSITRYDISNLQGRKRSLSAAGHSAYYLEPGPSLEYGLGVERFFKQDTLNSKKLELLTRADRAMSKDPSTYPVGDTEITDIRYLSRHAGDMEALFFRIKHFDIGYQLKTLQRTNRDAALVFLGVVVLAALYAGIHLAAWNYHFPTKAEMVLWRGSGVVVATAIPAAIVLFIILALICMPIDERFPKLENVTATIIWLPILLTALLYFSARVFLVIEAFISVRQMPIGVFVTISWSDYIPHL
ncbi:hypothetical protein F4777DRAFT_167834 [Nemania sp. FL0916]|nr:hypothetical protein F4777DRAFT_167834 [Nemania sp. FL0916]